MIITEIGLNHDGKVENILEYLEVTSKHKLSHITLQIRESDFYIENNLEELIINDTDLRRIIQYAKKLDLNIGLSTSCPLVLEKYKSYFQFVKVLSWKILDSSFVDLCINNFSKIYLSTGMSTMNEIKQLAVRLKLAHREKLNNKNVSFIHTTLSYELNEVNLNCISQMKKISEIIEICYGHHSPESDVLVASQLYEPIDTFIYLINNKIKNRLDEKHAIDCTQLESILERIKKVKIAIGDGNKIGKTENEIETKR